MMTESQAERLIKSIEAINSTLDSIQDTLELMNENIGTIAETTEDMNNNGIEILQ